MITWTNERRKLSDLIPWPRNPRQIKEAQARRLADSVETFGQVETLAIGPGNEVYNGHQRLNVLAAEHGPDYVVDVRVSSRELTEKEREKLTVYLHKGAAGEWDFDILANEFEVPDLVEWGFEPLELGIDLEPENAGRDTEPQIDKAAELQEKWGTRLGQVWELGPHRLCCGDCTDKAAVEAVMRGERAEISFTDPPYNVGVTYGDATNDNRSFQSFNEWCQLWLRFMPTKKILTVGVKNLLWWDEIIDSPQWIISWVKRNGQGQTGFGGTNKWDPILVYGCQIDKQIDIVEVQNDYSEKIKADGNHPTGKPTELWEKLLFRFCVKGPVYEPFCGTGVSIIASNNLGFECLAIEIEPKFTAVSLERFWQHTGIEPKLIAQ